MSGKFTEYNDEVVAALSAPVPASAIQKISRGGTSFRFTSDKWAMHRLDEVVGAYGWQDDYVTVAYARPLTKKDRKGNITTYNATVTCHLKVLGVMKSGQADVELINNPEGGSSTYGTPSTNAQAKAFKRAAMKHGVARELWDKDEAVDEDEEEDERPTRKPAAKSGGKLKTPVTLSEGQLTILREKGFKKADIERAASFDIVGAAIERSKKLRLARGEKLDRPSIEAILAVYGVGGTGAAAEDEDEEEADDYEEEE